MITRNERRRLATVVRRLLEWFEVHGREFKWRELGQTSYVQIVSEILLQRTKADVANLFLEEFLSSYPDWSALAGEEPVQLAQALKPIGLWRKRSRALIELALVLKSRNFNMPSNRFDIEQLPAVGQYVANAVELFEFSRARPLLDVNMARVLERYFHPRTKADIRYDPWLQALAHEAVGFSDPYSTNWAFLDLGALHCKPRVPSCKGCPLSKGCAYRKCRKAV